MAPLLGLLTLFVLICARYASRLNLWGDEAYSLMVAAKPVGSILGADPFHLPTYYLALHPAAPLFSVGLEWPLRLIHALIFCVGLGYGWRIAEALLGRGWAVWGVLLLTILLPNYIFYATNLRMYAPLFAASMAFLWTSFRLLEPGGDKGRPWAWHGLTALLCVLIDWPGGLLVALTWAALIGFRRRSPLARPKGSRLLMAAGAVVAAGAALMLREPLFRPLLAWTARQGGGGSGLSAVAKALFLWIRPLLDLVYPPAYPLALNLLLWALLALALPLAALVLWRGGNERERLVAVLAFSWVVGAPFGLALTRVFLPGQFFSLLGIALALRRLRHRPWPLAAPILWGCLIAVGLANLQQVVAPTLRIYSRIPYATIARDAVSAARERRLPLIAISRHTLNALSVERHGRTRLTGSQELRLLDSHPVCASFPRGTFVYVQLMPEDGEHSDPRRACAGQEPVAVEVLRSYVSFAELAYNPLWVSNLKDRGERGAAAQLLLVTIPGAGHGPSPPG
ncbi:MAG: hypothetical protein VKP70_03640 [Cyanobacteriota bacterium]|nr:hypothetical protein [Cyanobacteriota bacterium]